MKNIRKRIIEWEERYVLKIGLKKVLIEDSKVAGAVISDPEKGEYTYKTEDIVFMHRAQCV